MKFKNVAISLIIILIITKINCFAMDMMQEDDLYKITTKRDILTLMLAYPDNVIDVEKDNKDCIFILMKNGSKILYDDRAKKSDLEKESSPDLQDMLEVKYPLNVIYKVVEVGQNPGRIRSYELLNAVYGNSESDINKNLMEAVTSYGKFSFNRENNATKRLELALYNSYKAAQDNSQIHSYISPINGTFNYRYIKDTGRLSPHAYGIAIDLNKNNHDYWKWTSEENGSKRIASYPNEIVEAFENQGFIWGGKWNCFDILHFEYRPELIIKSKYFDNSTSLEEWYEGIEINEKTLELIKIIDEKIN